jgi:phage terminase large subunit
LLSLKAKFPEKLQPLFEPHRYKIVHGGRGGAKSWGAARALLIEGVKRPERILCAREVQRSIKDSVHKTLADQIIELGLTDFYEVLSNEIRGKNGTEFMFVGLSTSTIGSLKSYEGITKCWVEEGQVVQKKSWEILIPTIRTPSSEIWVTFNPDLDTDDTWVRFIENTPNDCIIIEMNWRDNPWFPEVLLEEKDHLFKTDKMTYENVWEGKCRAAAVGAIYAPEMQTLSSENRVRNVPNDPLLKTHTVWDLGFNDATAIIFVQRHLSELRIVDYIEGTYTTIIEYANKIKDRGYNLGNMWLPWDGAESKYRLTDAATSPEGMLRKAGLRPLIVPDVGVETGIKKARIVFPRCYFDSTKTVRLRECLKRYRRHVPSSTAEATGPMHDEFSHGADAFRYLALVADKLDNSPTNDRKLNYDLRGYA